MGWIFVGIIACALLGWYLYHRSRKETSADTEPPADVEENSGDVEDFFWTGVLLNEVYEAGADGDSPEDVDSDGYDTGDGGFDDGGGFEE